jgi:hypothetical protein
LPEIIQKDEGRHFQNHADYIRKKRDEYNSVSSYWMIRYLIRDDASKETALSVLHKKPFLKSYNQALKQCLGIKENLAKKLNEEAFKHFREHEVNHETCH